MRSDAPGPIPSLAAVKEAPTKIVTVLKAYSGDAARIAAGPKSATSSSDADRTRDQAAILPELSALKDQTLADLRRLERANELALADARTRLESAILPVMSTDPSVQRVFELRQAKALARLLPLLQLADTREEVNETVRRCADDAARQGDWAALRVLSAETTRHLDLRGIDPATAEAPRIIERTVLTIRPRAAEAIAERHALELGSTRVASAFIQACQAVQSNQREVDILGYEADAFERVTLTGEA